MAKTIRVGSKVRMRHPTGDLAESERLGEVIAIDATGITVRFRHRTTGMHAQMFGWKVGSLHNLDLRVLHDNAPRILEVI